jgi:elongation factor P--(R)-beta-lysine ligase
MRTALPSADLGRLEALAIRSAALRAIREFFHLEGFVEVETPTLLATPALELHIDAIHAANGFLRTSPELHMKRLLADGCSRIFQMGPCFRNGERGDRHNPEFTMLEWYRADADYLDILRDMRRLIPFVCQAVHGSTRLLYRGQSIELSGDWHRLTVQEAFTRWAGWDPVVAYDADRFDLDTVTKIEPNIPVDRPAILTDYPAPAAALARCRQGSPPVAERWELYAGGMELANAFTELVDAAEQRRRFQECAEERRSMSKEIYALDEEFLAALEHGMPPSGGVALGVDRLVMLLADASSIEQVRPFCR